MVITHFSTYTVRKKSLWNLQQIGYDKDNASIYFKDIGFDFCKITDNTKIQLNQKKEADTVYYKIILGKRRLLNLSTENFIWYKRYSVAIKKNEVMVYESKLVRWMFYIN